MSNILPAAIAQHISEYAEDVEEEYEEWETIYGCAEIYDVKHFVTYGGGPEGGYVFFQEPLPDIEPGWYRWHRTWFQPPSYTPLEPHETVIYKNDDCEGVRVVDSSYQLKGEEMFMADILAP